MDPRKHTRMPIVGGNWKMNTDLATAVELAEDVGRGVAAVIERCEVVVYPPFPYLQAVGRGLGYLLGQRAGRGLVLGGQDVYHEPNGAFTGEISAEMLLDLDATMVLVGHSERRHVIGEDDELIRKKLDAALDAGLSVTLCVGETMTQRDAGETEAVNLRQLEVGLTGLTPDAMRRIVIAYEPVWAIGTGHTASPEDAEAVHAFLRVSLAELFDERIAGETRIQYGGSVKPGNAADLIARDNIDGFLVGGASLKADDFLAIVTAAAGAAVLHPEARNE